MDLEAVRDEFEERAQPLMEALHVPGLAVGIVHGDEEISAGFGVTSLEDPRPVTDTTVFRIASNTKPYTATALMRKVEDGSLDLDAPLQRYLPDFELANPEWAQQLTARHLLTHTASLTDWMIAHKAAEWKGEDALEQLLAVMPGVPLDMPPPGSEFSYSNTGMSLAGRLLEVLVDRSYQEAIRELILDPLELANTFFRAEEAPDPGFAFGHVHSSLTEPPRVASWGMPPVMMPVGGLCSDVRDQLRWARFQLSDGTTPGGERLLRPETLLHMQSPHLEVSEWGSIGLPWMLGQLGSARMVSHGGFWNGQGTPFVMLPDHGFAILQMANADTAMGVLPHLENLIVERVLGLEDSDPDPIEVLDDALDEYVGTYEGAFTAVDIRKEDGALKAATRVLRLPASYDPPVSLPPITLEFFRKDCAQGADAGPGHGMLTRCAFIRNPQGRVQWLRWSGSIHQRTAPSA